MNRKMAKWAFFTAIILGIFSISHQQIQAQKVMATLNIKGFGIEKAVSANDTTNVGYDGELSLAANLRFFEQDHQWAFRLGAGFNKLNYQILGDDGFTPEFDVARKSMTAFIGVEKHFGQGLLRPFLGVFVPLTFNGDDEVKSIFTGFEEQIANGGLKTGFGLITGLNLRIKFINLGVEFNAGFDRFKSEVLDNLDDTSKIKLRNLDYNTEFVIGVAF